MVVATIDVPGEIDAYPATLFGGVDYVTSVFGQTIGGGSGRTLPNPAVFVLDANGNVLNGQDNSLALGADPLLTFKVPVNGQYIIAVTDLTGGVGSYEAFLNVSLGPFQFGSPVGDFGPGSFNIGAGRNFGGTLGVQGSAEEGEAVSVAIVGLPPDDVSAAFG